MPPKMSPKSKITAFFRGAKATINLDKMQAIFRNLGQAIRHYAACQLDKRLWPWLLLKIHLRRVQLPKNRFGYHIGIR